MSYAVLPTSSEPPPLSRCQKIKQCFRNPKMLHVAAGVALFIGANLIFLLPIPNPAKGAIWGTCAVLSIKHGSKVIDKLRLLTNKKRTCLAVALAGGLGSAGGAIGAWWAHFLLTIPGLVLGTYALFGPLGRRCEVKSPEVPAAQTEPDNIPSPDVPLEEFTNPFLPIKTQEVR